MTRYTDDRKGLVAEVLDSDPWRDSMMGVVKDRLSYYRERLQVEAREGDQVGATRMQGMIDGMIALVKEFYKSVDVDVPAEIEAALCVGPKKS